MKKFLFIAIFFITMGISALYCAPYYAMHTVQKSAVSKDIATLEKYIDFDAVQKNMDSPLNKDLIISILAQSIEPQNPQDNLDMTMGFSGDDHFMLSLEIPHTKNTSDMAQNADTSEQSPKNIFPIIFVFEKKNVYTWHVTEILMNE